MAFSFFIKMKQRKQENNVDRIFIDRWSSRAVSKKQVSKNDLMTLFEAARWAPSSYNNQPWRFIYAFRGTEHWDKLFDLLSEFNKSWVKNAGAIILVFSKKTYDYNGKPARTHSFDTGAVWQNLALQGSMKGMVVHGMSGFDYDRASQVFNLGDDYHIEVMIAVGYPGNIKDLPEDLQAREIPSWRKEISEIVFEGVW